MAKKTAMKSSDTIRLADPLRPLAQNLMSSLGSSSPDCIYVQNIVIHMDNGNASDAHYYELAQILIAHQKFEGAQAALNRTVELNPQHSGALNDLGVLAINNKDFSQAFEYFKKAFFANDTNAQALTNVLQFLKATNKKEELENFLTLIARDYKENNVFQEIVTSFSTH